MKSESLVIADQHAAVNTFPGLVHTARHTTEASNTRSRWPNPFGREPSKVGLVTGVKSYQVSRTGRCGWITSFLGKLQDWSGWTAPALAYRAPGTPPMPIVYGRGRRRQLPKCRSGLPTWRVSPCPRYWGGAGAAARMLLSFERPALRRRAPVVRELVRAQRRLRGP